MERYLKSIYYLLVLMVILLSIITGCQIFLATEATEPSRAEAKSESIQKVDLAKVGGYYISKWEFLGGKK